MLKLCLGVEPNGTTPDKDVLNQLRSTLCTGQLNGAEKQGDNPCEKFLLQRRKGCGFLPLK